MRLMRAFYQPSHLLRTLAVAALTLWSLPSLASLDQRPAVDGLSRIEADRRAALVSHTKYKLHFDLDARAADFVGEEHQSFDLAKLPDGVLTVDFDGGKIDSLMVNGKAVAKPDYNGKFLAIPAALLQAGANQVDVHFRHPYSATGKGLYRFKDPEDGRTYLYTDFEPYDANKLFPSFDQPNLKATYELTVDAPSAWVVVSSVRESSHKEAAASKRHWVFPESKVFSTYLFSLHAGDYKVWEDKAGEIPLRLFARQSMAKYVNAADWFTYTKQGLGFYQAYFAFPYPFVKLDQLIVPDFNAGAMENVAAITYSERYFQRGPSTRAERSRRAGVLLHEMAHQWFGDLVTMEWWNDLWLNESFATFMSTLALSQATEFKDLAWIDFFGGNKVGAYQEDQHVTTHPIEGLVLDSEQAFANFDGITYGKGASVLKQLNFYLGAETFRDGARRYFQAHQYKNATLADFMQSLGQAAKDEKDWSGQWLQTAGVNTVEAKFSCTAGKIAAFNLAQSAPADNQTLRSHHSKVGLYDVKTDGHVVLREAVPVTYDGPLTPIAPLVGKDCPAFVFPNYDDFDYVKVQLDPQSLTLAQAKIEQIDDPQLRIMVWHSLWNMVRDGTWPVTAYAKVLLEQAPHETEIGILNGVLATTYGWRGNPDNVINYLPLEKNLPTRRDEFLRQAASTFWHMAESSAPGSDLQKLWYDSYVRLGDYPAAGVRLEDLLAGKLKLSGFNLDQDRRWQLVQKLCATGDAKAHKLLAIEQKRDTSARGEQATITAEASFPTKAVKEKWYAEIINPKSKRSLAQLKSAMYGLFPPNQGAWRREWAPRYFQELVSAAQRDRDFVGNFAGSLVPIACTDESAEALKAFIAAQPKLQPLVIKRLRVAQQEDQQCTKIRAVAAAAPKV